MIISERFKGDSLYMQDIQHDLYMRHISTIFDKAKTCYLDALRVTDMETQLGLDIKEKTLHDHRTLQHMHDVIAARFRFLNRERLNQYAFSGVFSELSDEDFFTRLWLSYYERFLDWLYEKYPYFVSKVLIASTYPNPNTIGMDAEDFVYEKMKRFLPNENMDVEEWEFAFITSSFASR